MFSAIASERANVSTTVRELPSTLKQATTTLNKVEELARVLGPAAEEFRPAVVALREANRRTTPFAKDAAPRLAERHPPVRARASPAGARPAPAAQQLAKGTPDVTRIFKVINHFYNMLAYNPGGREGPEKEGREEGYLFHTGWLVHQVNSLFRTTDAHGPGRPVTFGGTCAIIENTLGASEELEALLGLTGALTDPTVCGGQPGTGGVLGLVDQLPITGELPPLPKSPEARARNRRRFELSRKYVPTAKLAKLAEQLRAAKGVQE